MNSKEMIRIDPDDHASMYDACTTMLLESLSVPEARALIEGMIDDPTVTRRELVHTAWAQGASFVLYKAMHGQLIALTVKN